MRSWIRKIVGAPLLYFVFMKIRPFTHKNTLLVICAFALIIYSVFSFAVISSLKTETKGLAESYGELIQMSVTTTMPGIEIHNALEHILSKVNSPIIITDEYWKPLHWNNVHLRNPITRKREFLPDTLSYVQKRMLDRNITSMRRSFKPIELYYKESPGIRFGYLLYGNISLIRSLFFLPFIEVGLSAAFVALLYLAFHNIRITERSNLWVGLAKETAHQLGTPISSIMGWVEYIRSTLDNSTPQEPGEILQILNHMDNDLRRLTKITSRFSQIGSHPTMVPCDIRGILTDISAYFQLRLPLLRKRITIEYDFRQMPLIHANKDLLEWVFENLLKNAIDAITRNDGLILIKTEHIASNDMVRIQMCDNGKGISWESQKKVFSPGFTTKRRGWGLGLTLAKRIIEDYHKGEIYIKWSQKEKGTIFHVDLPVSKANTSQQTTTKENQANDGT